MASPISLLYEPLISRDLNAIPGAVARFRREHSPHELLEAVTRFAILASSPSQHSRHAVLACLAAYQLREESGSSFDDLLTACAVYAAQSRPPWSEPPITDPPKLRADESLGREDLMEAIAGGDRLKAERWLSVRMHQPGFEEEFLEVGADDLSDMGHKLIISAAALQLSRIMGEKGMFATLRLATMEWTSYREPSRAFEEPSLSLRELLGELIDRMVASDGDSVAWHALELFDALMTAMSFGAARSVDTRVRAFLEDGIETAPETRPATEFVQLDVPVYSLARDYAEYLLATTVSRRLSLRFPTLGCDRIAVAARYNLEHGPSFEEWSFA